MNNKPPTETHDLDIHDVKPETRVGFSEAEWKIAYPLLVEAVSAMIYVGAPTINIKIEVSTGRIVDFTIDRQA
jgi:hypothetical protein